MVVVPVNVVSTSAVTMEFKCLLVSNSHQNLIKERQTISLVACGIKLINQGS